MRVIRSGDARTVGASSTMSDNSDERDMMIRKLFAATAAAGLMFAVAGCSDSDDSSAAASVATTTVTMVQSETAKATPQPPKLGAQAAVSNSLRDTAQAVDARGNDIIKRKDNEGYKAMLKEYATPECEAMVLGMLAVFGDPGDDSFGSTTTLISVEENGDTGTSVSRDDETGEDETTEWVRVGNEWRFTCDTAFSGE